MSNSNKKNRVTGILVIVAIIVIIGIFTIPDIFQNNKNDKSKIPDSTQVSKDTAKKTDTNFLKAVISDEDTNVRIIRVSEKSDLDVNYQIDAQAGKSVRRVFTGRRINIAVIGVDARLGTRSKRADANHVISVLIDQGIVEITSIPRDTPVDAGMPDTSGQNKLTILHATKGQKGYFDELAKIAGLDKIHYYVEVGFSQAMGIIELFGFKDPRSTLQVLRSRKGLGGDDYQRCYNQGQFMRQLMLRHFGKFTGFFGDILLRGGLALVNTNIGYNKAKEIITKLSDKGFPKSDTAVIVRVRPPITLNYKVYDFSNPEIITQLENRIERFNESNGEVDTSTGIVAHTSYKVAPRLWKEINKSIKDTIKNCPRVVGNLSTYFEQRAWLQVSDKKDREKIREQICTLLMTAYTKMKKFDKAEEVRNVLESEKKIFSVPLQ
ncbi:MAG: LytR family transcriptional regulator [Bacteroidetes bacterium]|nr:MAG: LytR family transcriptional regulator [Bacteroidota bacterium]